MKPRNNVIGLLAACAVFSFLSCATQSRLVSTWQLPSKDVGPYDKMVVFALMENQQRSKTVEMAAVDQLRESGVDAVPGFSVLGKKDIDPKDIEVEEMEQLVNTTGADAVMIYKVIAQDRDLRYVPPTSYVTTGAPHYHWWSDPVWGYYAPYPYHYWGYWYPAYQVTTTPGYWQAYDTYRVETVMYRTSDNRLVWSAVSETYNPDNKSDLGQSLTRRIVQRLARERIIES